MKNILCAVLLLLLPFASYSTNTIADSMQTLVDSAAAAEADYLMRLDSILLSLDYKKGTVTISGNLATVNVPQGFKFLNAKDAQTVLSELWGNPPDDGILGMLVPDSIDYFAAESWGISYAYEEEGHVKDGDAEDINYNDILDEMKNDNNAANKDRIKEGYQMITLVGWAKEPYYDKAAHKLHWAKELKFGKDSVNTLNYNIRMLGRKGVLVMNVIAGMDNIKVVDANMDKLLASTNFTNGNRYEDFDDSMDKVAEYGIGGLIAGGILAKTGVLAKLGIFFLKAWKIIAIAVIGFLGYMKVKFFGKKE